MVKKSPRRHKTRVTQPEEAGVIVERLAQIYPDSSCALNFSTPFELLIATVLSAQTTDKRVNSITPELFARFPQPEDFAHAPREELEKILHPLGFFRSKARSCQGIGQALCDKYGGRVPDTLDELVTLPGVGRKTANVVLGNVFDIPGITVDTHVGRLAKRWGWTCDDNPEKIEKDIARLLPSDIWTVTCHRIIDHGRAVCHARTPACDVCPLVDVCPSYRLYCEK